MWWTTIPARFLCLSVLIACAARPLAVRAEGPVQTFPPRQDSGVSVKDLTGAANAALYSGRPDQAYRLLVTAAPQLDDQGPFLDLCARVYLALQRPMRAAECYAKLHNGDSEASEKVRALLQRQGPMHPGSYFTFSEKPFPTHDKGSLKRIEAAVPGPDGSAYLLTKSALVRMGPDGKLLSSKPLPGARDLSLDETGRPLALGDSQILWGDRVIPLPSGLDEPASVAASPDGSLILLDAGKRRLFRLDAKGVPGGSAALTIRKPTIVRTDLAGRIYVADRDGDKVFVFGADMSPLRVLDPEASGHRVRKLEGLFVDFAGDTLLFDGRAHELLLFSSDGRFLGNTREDVARIYVAGWDGLNRIIYVDKRAAVLGRIGT